MAYELYPGGAPLQPVDATATQPEITYEKPPTRDPSDEIVIGGGYPPLLIPHPTNQNAPPIYSRVYLDDSSRDRVSNEVANLRSAEIISDRRKGIAKIIAGTVGIELLSSTQVAAGIVTFYEYIKTGEPLYGVLGAIFTGTTLVGQVATKMYYDSTRKNLRDEESYRDR